MLRGRLPRLLLPVRVDGTAPAEGGTEDAGRVGAPVVVLGDLEGRIAKDPSGVILRVNAETLAKRRRDLELRLDRELRDQQLDIVRY